MDVGTRTLRYFIAVAEELSFTRAAQRLLVSQPAISRAIRQLENNLRAPLFTRGSRDVRLTPAGAALLDPARRLIVDWELTERAARAAATNEQAILRLGFVATGAGPLTTRARSVFAERFPSAAVEPRRLDWGGEAAALRRGLVDVAFIWQPADLTGIEALEVAEERRMVGMAAGHRLAGRHSVSLADLRQEPIPLAPNVSQEWTAWWGGVPRPDGSAPVWGPHADNVEDLLEQVATGQGVCLAPASMAEYYARSDMAWRPVPDAEPLRVSLGWPASGANTAVFDFASVVLELSGRTARLAAPPAPRHPVAAAS